MSTVVALPKAKCTAITAVITRADGRIENLGLISYRNRNLLKHYAVNAYIRLKELFNDRSRTR